MRIVFHIKKCSQIRGLIGSDQCSQFPGCVDPLFKCHTPGHTLWSALAVPWRWQTLNGTNTWVTMLIIVTLRRIWPPAILAESLLGRQQRARDTWPRQANQRQHYCIFKKNHNKLTWHWNIKTYILADECGSMKLPVLLNKFVYFWTCLLSWLI